MESLRMCIACRQHKDKKDMKRIVRLPLGTFAVDKTGKANGRGAYVCSAQCLLKCKKARLLNRAFKCEVPQEVYEALTQEWEKA